MAVNTGSAPKGTSMIEWMRPGRGVMTTIMNGEATPSQIGAFLMGMRMKSETIDEIVGAATVMRELASPVNIVGERLVDTCGTGGDARDLHPHDRELVRGVVHRAVHGAGVFGDGRIANQSDLHFRRSNTQAWPNL